MQLGANERNLIVEFAQKPQDELSPRDLGATRRDGTFLVLESDNDSMLGGEDILRDTPVDVYLDAPGVNTIEFDVHGALDDIGRLDLLPTLVDGDGLLWIKNT